MKFFEFKKGSSNEYTYHINLVAKTRIINPAIIDFINTHNNTPFILDSTLLRANQFPKAPIYVPAIAHIWYPLHISKLKKKASHANMIPSFLIDIIKKKTNYEDFNEITKAPGIYQNDFYYDPKLTFVAEQDTFGIHSINMNFYTMDSLYHKNKPSDWKKDACLNNYKDTVFGPEHDYDSKEKSTGIQIELNNEELLQAEKIILNGTHIHPTENKQPDTYTGYYQQILSVFYNKSTVGVIDRNFELDNCDLIPHTNDIGDWKAAGLSKITNVAKELMQDSVYKKESPAPGIEVSTVKDEFKQGDFSYLVQKNILKKNQEELNDHSSTLTKNTDENVSHQSDYQHQTSSGIQSALQSMIFADLIKKL